MTSSAPVFVWRKAYELNVSPIDEQHKKLVSLLSDLQAAMQSGKGHAVMKGVLDELASYTVWHFQAEENMMREDNYPAYTQHATEHRLFVQDVKQFLSDFEAGKTSMTIKVLQFLRNWLFEHIQDTDRRFAEYHLGLK
jgi:hemerythrin